MVIVNTIIITRHPLEHSAVTIKPKQEAKKKKKTKHHKFKMKFQEMIF